MGSAGMMLTGLAPRPDRYLARGHTLFRGVTFTVLLAPGGRPVALVTAWPWAQGQAPAGPGPAPPGARPGGYRGWPAGQAGLRRAGRAVPRHARCRPRRR